MPRYYFDFDDGETLLADREGVELEGPRNAECEATETLWEKARGGSPGDERHLVMSVRNEYGRQVVVVRLVLQVEAPKLN